MSDSYNNNLSPLAIKRIIADRNLVESDKQNYKENFIFFKTNPLEVDNLFTILVIGSDDITNPYFGGFYFFDGMFPNEYPFRSPSLKAITQGECMRFHPTFSRNGKCCLSILGTWSGPPWTSCQNIGTLAHSLKSLYIHNPMVQEPGWETKKNELTKTYERMVTYRNLEVAVLNMILNTTERYKSFFPAMIEFFNNNYENYIKKLEELMPYNDKTEYFKFYDLTVTYKINELKHLFNQLHNNQLKNNKISRKSPPEPANKYNIGFKKKSDNDGNIWVVRELSNKSKRWFKENN